MSRLDRKASKEKQEKDLKKLYRELDKLRSAIYRMEKVELPEPRFGGFKRFYVLRDDVARRKDAKDIQGILDKINSSVTSKTKDFSRCDTLDKSGKTSQSTKKLSVKEHAQLSPHQQTFFFKYWSGKQRCYKLEFLYPWMLVFKIKRFYITHVPLLSPDMESRIQEIQNKITKNNWWPRIYKMMGWRMYSWDYNLPKIKLVEKLVDDAINETKYEDKE
jgi:hypothetical protein